MTLMEHLNGCVHKVRDEDLEVFLKAGWKIKAVPSEPPVSKPKAKRKTAQK